MNYESNECKTVATNNAPMLSEVVQKNAGLLATMEEAIDGIASVLFGSTNCDIPLVEVKCMEDDIISQNERMCRMYEKLRAIRGRL